MARAKTFHDDISYIDDELRNNSEPFVHTVNEKSDEKCEFYHSVILYLIK